MVLEYFDARAYADKHGFVKFEPRLKGELTGSDYAITVSSNGNHSMSIGLTKKQAWTLLNEMGRVLQDSDET